MTKAIKVWVERNKEKFQSPADQEHLVDFLMKNFSHKGSINFTYEVCVTKTKAWVEAINKKARLAKTQGQVETLLDFGDGMTLVQLLDKDALKWEGSQMGHCVASYSNPKLIYSLRDESNFPHATLEVDSFSYVRQIKGKGNRPVLSRYAPYVVEFLQKTKFKIINQYDALRLGFFHCNAREIKDIKRTFKNVVILNKRYVYDAPDLTLKEGVDLLAYDFGEYKPVPWYKKDKTLYYNSVGKFINILNATEFHRKMDSELQNKLVRDFGSRNPRLAEYKTLFLRDKDLAMELFLKFGMDSTPEDWSSDCDELCATLLKKGYNAEAYKVFDKHWPFKYSGKGDDVRLPKISAFNDTKLNEKIIYAAAETLRIEPVSYYRRNKSDYIITMIGGWTRQISVEQLRLIMEAFPEFDVSMTLKGDSDVPLEYVKEAIKLSNKSPWVWHVAVKDRPQLKTLLG